jgi:hypothetical protein
MTDLGPIKKDLAKLIRLLASDKDGEVIAARHGLIRKLKSIGADIHDLADRIENPVGEISEAEMEKIYKAGVEEGRRAEKQARAVAIRGNGPVEFPSAQDMAIFCYQNKANLKSEWENEFVVNMASWTRTIRPLSPKQQMHLEKIYIKLGGRI